MTTTLEYIGTRTIATYSNKPLRVSIRYEDEIYHFCNIRTGSDGSFYIHPYRSTNRWLTPARSVNDNGQISISIEDFIESNFDYNKLSLHPSGFLHLTDRFQNRREDGIRLPRFEEMVLPFSFLCLVPCNPSNLPAFRENRRYLDLTFAIPRNSPPVYAVFDVISRDDAGSEPDDVIGVYMVFFGGHRFGLSIGFKMISGRDGQFPVWPSHPFQLMRTSVE